MGGPPVSGRRIRCGTMAIPCGCARVARCASAHRVCSVWPPECSTESLEGLAASRCDIAAVFESNRVMARQSKLEARRARACEPERHSLGPVRAWVHVGRDHGGAMARHLRTRRSDEARMRRCRVWAEVVGEAKPDAWLCKAASWPCGQFSQGRPKAGPLA